MPRACFDASPKASASCSRTGASRPPGWNRSMAPRLATRPAILSWASRAAPSPASRAKPSTRTSIASSMGAAEVFMDSAGFLALWDAGDEYHAAAIALQEELAGKHRRFLTTEYVVDETVTLPLVRHSHAAAVDFLDTVERSEALRLEWIGPERFHAAGALFRKHSDKEWSF